MCSYDDIFFPFLFFFSHETAKFKIIFIIESKSAYLQHVSLMTSDRKEKFYFSRDYVFIDLKSGSGFPVCLKGKRARRAEIRSPPGWESTSKGRNSRGARRNEARW